MSRSLGPERLLQKKMGSPDGHPSVETTERYLGSRQRFLRAVNDHIGIEPLDGSS
jgi:hypothetical protein